MENKDKLYSILNLMRRMHPSKINQNVQALVNLAPDLEEEILQRVDQPLGNIYVYFLSLIILMFISKNSFFIHYE